MNSMIHLLFHKFRHWSNDDLQGQPGELFQHFGQLCLWKGGHNAVGFQQTETLRSFYGEWYMAG